MPASVKLTCDRDFRNSQISNFQSNGSKWLLQGAQNTAEFKCDNWEETGYGKLVNMVLQLKMK